MKTVLITGSNGQLGRAIASLYGNDRENELVGTDVRDLDITDIDAVMKRMREAKPYAVVNCAAHTAVDACESEWDSAYKINGLGARNLAIAAQETGAKMVQISTDYVFPGTASEPYVEFDRPDPLGAYGKTKFAGEEYVKQFSDRFFIIRTAWLYGDGKNFVKTMLNLAKSHDTVRVVGDQFGTPTSADELAKAIFSLLPTENFGIFHGTCEGSCSWADFAEEIFRLAKLPTRVERITTEEFGAKAPRPAYSVLENYMLKLTGGYRFADWEEAAAKYVAGL